MAKRSSAVDLTASDDESDRRKSQRSSSSAVSRALRSLRGATAGGHVRTGRGCSMDGCGNDTDELLARQLQMEENAAVGNEAREAYAEEKMVADAPELGGLLANCLEKDGGRSCKSWICAENATLVHVEQRDWWSCGYRNVQMLCRAMMGFAELKERVFDGLGMVPDVRGLQRAMEKAWSRGFDPRGAEHYGRKLVGKCEWVGAVEASVLFRSFGVGTCILDFEGGQPASRLFRFVELYFRFGVNKGFQRFREQTAAEWRDEACNYEETTEGNGCVYSDGALPMYMQYHGHSELVVGFQRKSADETYLLLFNPAKRSQQVVGSLVTGEGWKSLIKRSVSELSRKGALQLVAIIADDFYNTQEEIELSKVVTSVKM